jgi:2-phosphoglycerate kinase
MTQPGPSELAPLGASDLPYSKGLLTSALAALGLPTMRAYALALRVQEELERRGAGELDLAVFEEAAQDVLGPEEGGSAVRKLRLYRQFQRLDVPVVVLIGGGTGSGKSRVATDVAYRLGITRVTSTDVVRHTMRAFFSESFMPTIHHSSFEAGRALRGDDDEEQVLDGFLDQTRNVLVGVGAVIERALQERWSIVLEGVHLVPGLLPSIEGAIVVHCVLHIRDRETHASHFWVRDSASEGLRPVQRYLDSLDDIRLLQSAIVQRAERNGVRVIENTDLEQTITTVLELILDGVEIARGVAAVR